MRRDLLRWPVALFGALVVVGVVGYRLIEGWSWLDSLWMVAITVTTIGYGEAHPMSTAGRAFTIALIAANVGVGGYAIARLTAYVAEGGLSRDIEERRRRHQMDQLRDHFVVVGFGRLGREVASDLVAAGQRVVVIDPDERSLADAPPGVIALHGDGSLDATLVQAGVQRAAGLAVATPSSAVNVFVTLSARQLNPDLYIVTRIDDRDAASKAARAGADRVVSPFASGGSRIAHGLLHPHAAQFLDQIVGREHPDIAVDDVPVEAKEMTGPMRQLQIRDRFGIVIVAIRKKDGDLVAIPPPDHALQIGDIVVAVGTPTKLATFKAAATARR